jgi:hypothetical protein
MGAFSEWQPIYAERGIVTFPVQINGKNKKPAISNYMKVGQRASGQLALKYSEIDALGFVLGPRSHITVLDVDTPDERVLADALARHGSTPIIVRSGSGNHQAWYRHSGERCDTTTWRKSGLPIDILGGGFVVAPPSKGAKGPYQFIQGSLADLDRLPALRGLETPLQPVNTPSNVAADSDVKTARNDSLWRRCMVLSKSCETEEQLLRLALAENAKFPLPLDHREVKKLTSSAWGYEERGLNFIGVGHVVPIRHAEIDEVMDENPDAFILLTKLRRYHWARPFVVANAMADAMPPKGWTVKRLASARRYLERNGYIQVIRNAGRGSGPALYRWPTRKGGQI